MPRGNPNKTKIARIDLELDTQIRDLADKSGMSFARASKEIARMNKELKGKKVREIVF